MTWFPAFSDKQLSLIVKEAHRWGIQHVTAHATSPQAIKMCLDAGIDGIEHATFRVDGEGTTVFDPEVASLMAQAGAYVGPTLQTSARTPEERSSMSPLERARYDKKDRDKREHFSRLLEYDITFVSGSDAGWGSQMNRFGNLALGLRMMAESGMPAEQVLESATSAARALGIEDIAGALESGKRADFIVLRRNPTEDIGALTDIAAVFLEGVRIR